MTTTRAQIERLLLSRVKGIFSKVDFDLTFEGDNPDLNDPIGFALRQCGETPSNPASVTDADFAELAAADFDKLLDFAELRALENAAGNLTLVDVRAGPLSESLGQIQTNLEKRITRLQEKIAKLYNTELRTAAVLIVSEYDN